MTINETNLTSQPLVSVIIPTYNYGSLITETLESLQGQTLAEWECVVVDDGSTDDTGGVVMRFAKDEPRVRYIWQKNQRQAVAKNSGLAGARGKYIQFLDADDLIEPHKLERQVAYLESHPEVDIVYGDVRYFRSHNPYERLYSMGKENVPWMSKVSGEGVEVLTKLVRHNIMVINSPLMRRSIVGEVGLFDAGLPPAEDWDYWLRCAAAGKCFQFLETHDTMALVRIHSGSSSQDRIRMHKAAILIRKKLAALIKDKVILDINRELRARDEAELGILQAGRGSSLWAMWHLLNSVRLERRWRFRMKLFACALVAPFVSESRLRVLIASSASGFAKNLVRSGSG